MQLCVNHPLHPSFFVTQALELLHPDAARRRDADAHCSTLRRAPGLRSSRSSQAILMHPDLYDGPRMVKPPVVFNAGLLRAVGRRHRHDRVGLARPDGRPAALLPAERRRLGLHALARHRDVPRALVDRRSYVLERATSTRGRARAALRRDRDRRGSARARRSRSGATRRSPADLERCLADFAQTCARRRHRRLGAAALPRDAPERPAAC